MAYIGNTATTQAFTPAVDYFNGDGATVAFTLSKPVASVAQVQAVIENVPQNPGSAYTVSGNTITFTSAPPSGTSNIYVYYTSPITQVIAPSQGTVGSSQLQSNLSLTGNLNLASTGARITGDFSNATVANRVAFQTSTTNGNTPVSILPNGTGNVSNITLYNNSDPTNSAAFIVGVRNSGTEAGLNSSITGTGTYLPMTFLTGGSERMRIDTSGNLQFNSGYGSVATAYGCRAWVNFNGTGTVAIRGSGNVSSITDNGTGNYTVNFTTAMPDVNYPVSGMASDVGGTGNRGLVSLYKGVTTPAVGSFRIFTFADTTQTDNEYIYCSVFR